MGGLISGFFNPELPSDVVVDFDKIEKPTGAELELFNLANDVLDQAQTTISVVDGYKGCGDLILCTHLPLILLFEPDLARHWPG